MRTKIHLTIDKKVLQKIEFISSELYIPMGVIFDSLIEYSLKKQCAPLKTVVQRKKITTTVNPDSWNRFKAYCNVNHYKYNNILEASFNKKYRSYIRQIKNVKLS